MHYGELNLLVLQAVCGRTFANVMAFLESQASQSCLPGNAASFVTPEEKIGFEDVKRLSSFGENL